MKRLFLILCCLFIYSIVAKAQSKVGLKFGASYSNLVKNRIECSECKFLPGFNIGFIYSYQIQKKWKLRTELFYVLKGFDLTPSFSNSRLRSYWALPLLVSYEIAPKFNLVGGAEMGYKFYDHILDLGNLYLSSLGDGSGYYLEQWDFGLSIGAVVQLSEKWSFDTRFTRSIFFSNKDFANKFFNQSFYFSLVRYFGKK